MTLDASPSSRTGRGRTIRLTLAAICFGLICAGVAKLVSAVGQARNAARAAATT